MIRLTTVAARLAGVAVLAALVLPTGASAHPGIFTVVAKIASTVDPTNEALLTNETQYAIANDGYAIVLRESNNSPGPGMINYKVMPTAFRANFTADQKRTYGPAQSHVQPHATCQGVAALESGPTILAWQSDPFYNYVPWQKTGVGIADDPSRWIPVVKTATGVDLASLNTVADFTGACTALGGTYVPGDTVVTSPTSISSATIAEAVAPVTAAKVAAEGALGTANARVASTEAARVAAVADADAARAESRRLLIAATPLKVALGMFPALETLATAGAPVTVTGAPLQLVRVRLLTTETKARTLKLRSRVLASATTTLGADGVAALTLKPTAAAGAAIGRTKGSLPVTVDVAAGDRAAAISAILKR